MNDEKEKIIIKLKENGCRITKQRKKILDIMLKRLSDAMMRRIQGNYKGIVSINGALIALGVAGLIQPTTSALLHNTSTIAISLRSMKSLLPET